MCRKFRYKNKGIENKRAKEQKNTCNAEKSSNCYIKCNGAGNNETKRTQRVASQCGSMGVSELTELMSYRV